MTLLRERDTVRTDEHIQGPSPKPVVVCVDDEPAILASLQRLLRKEPLELLTTLDPQQALTWVRTREVGLLIADQRMPEISGTKLLGEVFELSPDTACAILTGYPGDSLVIRARECGSLWLMSKPWEDERLKQAIRDALRDRPTRGTPPQEIRLDCAGGSIPELIADFERALDESERTGASLHIELENLSRLRGPLVRFLRELEDLARDKEVGLVLTEHSGLAQTIRGLIDGTRNGSMEPREAD